MEEGGGADQVRAGLEGHATCGLRVLQVVNAGEMAVGERRVGQRPQVLGGLEFGGVGRQEQQMHMVGDAQVEAGMPAGPVERQHDVLARSSAHFMGKGREVDLKERDTDR